MAETDHDSWKYKVGVVVFFIPFATCFLSPFAIPYLGLSPSESGAVVAASMVLEELLWFSSIAFLGMDGFNRLKKKTFKFLNFSNKKFTKKRFRRGILFFGFGVASQSLVHIFLLIAYIVYGADPGQKILGMDFEAQAAAYAGIIVVGSISTIIGTNMLGPKFIHKLKNVFHYEEYND